MRSMLELDEKRRVVFPKEVEEEYGTKFVIVRLPGEILLKPLPEDPIKALQEEGRKLKGVTIKKFKKEVEEHMKARV